MYFGIIAVDKQPLILIVLNVYYMILLLKLMKIDEYSSKIKLHIELWVGPPARFIFLSLINAATVRINDIWLDLAI